MPTTLTGALIFVLGLFPGYIYTLRAEHKLRSVRAYSALREIVSVVFASAVSLALAVAVFGVLRIVMAAHTPDVGQLVRSRSRYVDSHYTYLIWWLLGLFAMACLIAYGLAIGGSASWVERVLGVESGLSYDSTWFVLFQAKDHQDDYKVVSCQLTNGQFVQGTLYTYSPDLEISPRELILSAPLTIRPPTGPVQHVVKGAVAIAATQIVYLHVRYVDDAAYERENAAITDGVATPWAEGMTPVRISPTPLNP